MQGSPRTPLEGVVNGDVTVGVAPCDHVLAEALGEDRVAAIATIVQGDISALCVLAEGGGRFDGVSRPGLLSGARYASCGYPLEKAAIDAMILKVCIQLCLCPKLLLVAHRMRAALNLACYIVSHKLGTVLETPLATGHTDQSLNNGCAHGQFRMLYVRPQDGGTAGVQEVCPQLRTETETLLIEGCVDCAWLYRPWEVVRS